jgi:hypothetical protein
MGRLSFYDVKSLDYIQVRDHHDGSPIIGGNSATPLLRTLNLQGDDSPNHEDSSVDIINSRDSINLRYHESNFSSGYLNRNALLTNDFDETDVKFALVRMKSSISISKFESKNNQTVIASIISSTPYHTAKITPDYFPGGAHCQLVFTAILHQYGS